MLNNDEIPTSTSVAEHVPYLRIGDESGRFGETEESRETNSFIIRFAPLGVQRIYERGDVTMEWLKAHQKLTLSTFIFIHSKTKKKTADLSFLLESKT